MPEWVLEEAAASKEAAKQRLPVEEPPLHVLSRMEVQGIEVGDHVVYETREVDGVTDEVFDYVVKDAPPDFVDDGVPKVRFCRGWGGRGGLFWAVCATGVEPFQVGYEYVR